MFDSRWHHDDSSFCPFYTPADLRRANCLINYDWTDPFRCGRHGRSRRCGGWDWNCGCGW